MLTLLAKYVWVERAMVTIATVAASFGWSSQSDVSTIAAGGITGAVVFMQVLGAVVSHLRTTEAKVMLAARDAGKAL